MHQTDQCAQKVGFPKSGHILAIPIIMLILVSEAKRSDCSIRVHLNILLEYINLLEASTHRHNRRKPIQFQSQKVNFLREHAPRLPLPKSKHLHAVILPLILSGLLSYNLCLCKKKLSGYCLGVYIVPIQIFGLD